MNARTGKRIIAISAALVFLLVLFVLAGSRGLSARTQRLPDGSYLKLVSVSYDRSVSYTISAPKHWQKVLAAHLPASLVTRLGWWGAGSGSVRSSARPGESNFAVITVCEQATPTSFTSAQLVLCDPKGQPFGTASGRATCNLSDRTHYRQLVCWTVDASPPRTKTLRLRFSVPGPDGKTRQPVAEFVVPNPALSASGQEEKGVGH